MLNFGAGVNLVPSPKYTISPNYFYYGNYVLGGYVVIDFYGTHHAEDAQDLYESKLGLLDTLNSCQTLLVSNQEAAKEFPFFSDINRCMGEVRDVKVSEGSDPLNLNYSVSIHCTVDNHKKLLIENNSGYSFPSGIVVQSYSEKVTREPNNSTTFAVFGLSSTTNHPRPKQYLTNSPSKLKCDISINTLPVAVCDSAEDQDDVQQKIKDYLYGRVSRLALCEELSRIHHIDIATDNFSLAANNTKISMKKTSGSISFELYVFPRPSGLSPPSDTSYDDISDTTEPLAIIELNRTEERDQITGHNKFKVKGSVKGIRDTVDVGASYKSSDTSPNMYNNPKNGQTQTWANTLDIYNKASHFFVFPDTGDRLIDAGVDFYDISYPFTARSNPDTRVEQDQEKYCIALTDSKVSEFPSSNKIDFEYTYEGVDKYNLLGFKLSTHYEERPAVTGRVEHIIPGEYTRVQLSNSTTAPQKKITVRADFPNGCYREKVGADQGRLTSDGIKTIPYKEDIHKAVSGQMDSFNLPTAVDSEYGVQWLLKSESLHEGKTFISLTKEYIACDTRD